MVREAVRCAQRGDLEGVHFLYVRFAPDVRRYIAGVVHDQHEAEGLTEAVFAKLLTTIGGYRQCEAPFSTWVLDVARSLLRSRG